MAECKSTVGSLILLPLRNPENEISEWIDWAPSMLKSSGCKSKQNSYSAPLY